MRGSIRKKLSVTLTLKPVRLSVKDKPLVLHARLSRSAVGHEKLHAFDKEGSTRDMESCSTPAELPLPLEVAAFKSIMPLMTTSKDVMSFGESTSYFVNTSQDNLISL